ncbi:hypothetical protein K2O51_31665 (plasmid) [Cupriavidus pinatubonensis]|uniref:hypothetical protein n=1 Tax=Cupriavidus pinatubonensis TaxID=248026 RepID=UPI001C737F74|nr:hypothetical protein [Cupriavidus pinatubonensis]QYY33586.1 hypothetical protein K2O51_31665 [Cupriavidus pinatubonensis]
MTTNHLHAPIFNNPATQLIESMLMCKRVWTENGYALSMIWIKAFQGMPNATSPVDALLAHAKTEAALNAMALAGNFTEREVQVLSFQGDEALMTTLQRFGDASNGTTATIVSVEVDVSTTNQHFASMRGGASATVH